MLVPCVSEGGPIPGRIHLSSGPANLHPTSVTVDRGQLFACLRVLRVVLMDRELWWDETVPVECGWIPNGVLVGGDTAAACEERTGNHILVRYLDAESWTVC
jgi:hypothetical protein